jgi:hypothetical protein
VRAGKGESYLVNISVTRSISCSAAAIFSADEGCGRPSPNIDIIELFRVCLFKWSNGRASGGSGWRLVMMMLESSRIWILTKKGR